LAGSRAGLGGREIPARLSTFQTVEWQKPVAPATSRGPQPVLRRQAQIASASSGASCLGERCGRLERSKRQDSVARACSLPASQRCHQRCAVAGDTLKAAAAAFSVIPSAIAETSA
jgi:putative hemolysin